MPKHDNGYGVVSVRNASGSAYAEFLYVPPRLADLPAGFITTAAGMGSYQRLYGPGASATISPEGLAFDQAGNLYTTQAFPGFVVRIRADRTIEKIAGTGDVLSPAGDGGPATDASIAFPRSVALDPSGNAYVPDVHYRIRRIDATTGFISTIAGTGTRGYSGDGGIATAADIGQPTYVAADGDSVFFIDFDAMRVRRIRNGTIATYAGSGSAGFSGDGGVATLASFDVGVDDHGGLALDSAGNLYLADSRNRRIRRIDRATNIITTFIDASDQKSAWFADHFEGIAIDANDHLYFGGNGFLVEFDASAHYLRKWQGRFEGTVIDGALADAFMGDVKGIAIDRSGGIVFADAALQRIRRIDPADANARPAESVRVNFLAPAAGASCTLSNPFAITNADGVADVTCTPNCVGGAYVVAATPLTANSTASVAFTNAERPCRRRSVRH